MMTRDQIHSYFHCKACMTGNQTERLEVGLTPTGILVCCKKHGVVGGFTPAQLTAEIQRGPRCECCPGGAHSN